MRPVCIQCGIHPAKYKSYGRGYSKYCSACEYKPWVAHKKDHCELCGFVPIHRVQLDVDHIDCNKSNNSPENLQTLCANCHRLKTYLNADHNNKEQIELETMQLALDI